MWFVFNFGHFGCGKKDKLIITFKSAFGNNKIYLLQQRSKCIWFIECKFLVRPFSRLLVGNASLHRRTDLSQVTSTPADADHHWYHHLQCLFHLCPGVPSIVHFGTHTYICGYIQNMETYVRDFSRFRWVEYEPFNNPNTKLSTKNLFTHYLCGGEKWSKVSEFTSKVTSRPPAGNRWTPGDRLAATLHCFSLYPLTCFLVVQLNPALTWPCLLENTVFREN